MTEKAGATRIKVTGQPFVRQRDLLIKRDDASWFDRLSQSKRRSLDICLARVLDEGEPRRGSGGLWFSTTEAELKIETTSAQALGTPE